LYLVPLTGLDDTTGCPASAIGVIDLTATQNAVLAPGSSYSLSVAFITCGYQYTIYGGAFIDWNRDGVWDTSSGSKEAIFYSDLYTINNYTFTVPTDASAGVTRMRVQVQEVNPYSPYDPCKYFTYGGTKDYSITIGSAYCINVGPTSNKDAALGPVVLAGETQSINDNTACPGAVGLQDLTSMVADLYQGGSYTLTTHFITCGLMYNIYGGAWIDYDGNGSWSSPFEMIFLASSFGSQTITFTVPQTAKPGITRMRVQVQEINDPTQYSVCSLFDYGGTKDFSIHILASSKPVNGTKYK